jgi:hypothetical protein
MAQVGRDQRRHMATVEEHISPDGRLRLIVDADADGDLAVGFDGFQWHTHADLLASFSGLSEAEAVRRFVDDLLQDRSVIAVRRTAAEVRDVWISDEPEDDAADPIEGETIELRYWSGRPWRGARHPVPEYPPAAGR